MRAKVVLSASVLALAILVPAIYFHLKPDSPTPTVDQSAAADNNAPPASPPSILNRVIQARPQDGLPARSVDEESSAVDHDTYVTERKAQLTELGMTDDPANLKIILSEMENPDPEIRKAALNATVDFGSQDAVPTLQNEMNWATDPQEKVDIKKAIDFLQLPHLTPDDGTSITQQSPPPTN